MSAPERQRPPWKSSSCAKRRSKALKNARKPTWDLGFGSSSNFQSACRSYSSRTQRGEGKHTIGAKPLKTTVASSARVVACAALACFGQKSTWINYWETSFVGDVPGSGVPFSRGTDTEVIILNTKLIIVNTKSIIAGTSVKDCSECDDVPGNTKRFVWNPSFPVWNPVWNLSNVSECYIKRSRNLICRSTHGTSFCCAIASCHWKHAMHI